MEDESDIPISNEIEALLYTIPNVDDPIICFRHGEKLVATNPLFDEFAATINKLSTYAQHEFVYIARDQEFDAIFIAAVHNSKRGPGLGGCRESYYDSLTEALNDVLRLSEGMTLKCAIANLPFGGAKGVIMLKPGTDSRHPEFRIKLYKNWGRFVAKMLGIYITAEDLGNSVEDTKIMLSTCRFVSCLPVEVGGGGNPSPHTAHGVLLGIKSCVEVIYHTDSLRSLVINVQGAGNVGSYLIAELLEADATVRVSDIDSQAIDRLKSKYSSIEVCNPDESFLAYPCDVFAPCARGGILNHRTIPILQCRIVAGAANNQLENPINDALLLAQRGIVYGPDFSLNRGGVINAAQEIVAPFDVEAVREKVELVKSDMEEILAQSTLLNPPSFIATKIALERAEQLHPLYGHLGARRITQLLKVRQGLQLSPAA